MLKPTKAEGVAEYLAAVPAERKEAIHFLHGFIRKSVPTLKSYFAHNMLGYGPFPCRNYKKEIIPWPTIALANQKNYFSIYVCAVKGGTYLAEKYKKKILQQAAKRPGLPEAKRT